MATTKTFDEFYTPNTTEEDVLKIAIEEGNFDVEDFASAGLSKKFKITITVEEIPS